MDNQTTPNQKPTYLSTDGSDNVLNNLDIQPDITTTKNTANENVTSADNIYGQYGYSSPYANNPAQNQPQTPTPAASTPNYTPNVTTSSQQPHYPQVNQNPATPVQQTLREEPKVVYEKTIVEKGPSAISMFIGQTIRFIGCFLFIIVLVLAIFIYTINF